MLIGSSRFRGLNLDFILNTHHHWDHTGGNEELKKRYKSRVVGHKADQDRIPAIDVALADGDTWQFGDLEMRVLDTPGHTRGHITLHFPLPGAVFTGLLLPPLKAAHLTAIGQMQASASTFLFSCESSVCGCGCVCISCLPNPFVFPFFFLGGGVLLPRLVALPAFPRLWLHSPVLPPCVLSFSCCLTLCAVIVPSFCLVVLSFLLLVFH